MLTLHKPEYEDLWFRRLMLEDEETMSYNHAWGGTIPFPEENWKDWYDFWITEGGKRRFYRYLHSSEDGFVGEIAYHYDRDLPGFIADVIIYSKFRGKGYGSEGLDMLCDAARENGIAVICDDIAVDNPAADLFLRHGFEEQYRTGEKIILRKQLAEEPQMRLERFTESDKDLYEQLVFCEDIMTMNLGRTFTEEEAGLFFGAMLRENAEGSDCGFFKAYVSSCGREDYIGMGVLSYNGQFFCAEIEYMVLPQYWDLGYGTRLAGMLTDMAERSGMSSQTIAITDPGNVRSRRVLLNNGYTFEKDFTNDDGEAAQLYVRPVSGNADGDII